MTLTLLTTACAGREPQDEATDDASELAQADEPAAPELETPGLRRFLPDQMRRSTRPESFAHDAHVEIGCVVCHTIVPGHDSHGELGCAECHLASALTSITSLSPAECQRCHHAPDQRLMCDACHEPPGALTRSEVVHLSVWERPRARDLALDHAQHEEVSCSACHAGGPELAAPSCNACHGEHHVESVRCTGCHIEAGAGAHDMAVHLTCRGSGCHSEPAIELIADRRAVCLACHVAEEDHEPGRECVDCHQLGRGGADMDVVTAGVWRRLAGAGR